jgi:acyl dehydratase
MNRTPQPGFEAQAQDLAVRVTSPMNLAALVGTEFVPGHWRSITQGEVDRFIELTGDRNWIHTDTQRAERELDGQTIVPGQLLLSLIPTLLQQAYVVTDAVQSRAAGMHSVRFRRAVHPGDAFRLRAKLTRVEKRSRFVQVDAACNLELMSGQLALTSQRTDVFFD